MNVVLTGSLGHIGSPLTQYLLDRGHAVTVISSSPERRDAIEALGARAAIGSMKDTSFLTDTFRGADVVYLMEATPSEGYFDPGYDIYADVHQIGLSYREAVRVSGVTRVVHLSSIGGHTATGVGILRFHHDVESLLRSLPEAVHIKFMRPVGFYYNMLALIPQIKHHGAIVSNYGGDEPEPWVSPRDIAAAVAEEIDLPFAGRTVRYIASDEVAPNEVARVLGAAIGKPDLAWEVVPAEQRLKDMLAAGMNPTVARGFIAMDAARVNGILYEDYYRNRPSLGGVKLADFARDFATAYQKA